MTSMTTHELVELAGICAGNAVGRADELRSRSGEEKTSRLDSTL